MVQLLLWALLNLAVSQPLLFQQQGEMQHILVGFTNFIITN